MKSFRLSSLMLLVTVVALAIGVGISRWEAAKLREELARLRMDFGLVEVTDPSKTYIRRFVNQDYRIPTPGGKTTNSNESYRVIPGADCRYVLHLTEMDNPSFAYPALEALKPDATVSLGSSQPEYVISTKIRANEKTPRIVVALDSEIVIDHSSPESWGRITQTSTTWMGSGMGTRELGPGDKTRLFWWEANQFKRGFMLWLEPADEWEARKKELFDESAE